GYAAGLYAGSQTISASMGLATDAINRLGLAADQAKGLLDAMPVAYAVTYIFGTVGSAILLALLGPRLLGIDLVAACKAYEERQGGGQAQGGAGSAWHRWELRAFRVQPSGKVVGLRAVEAEALLPDARVFVLHLGRRQGPGRGRSADGRRRRRLHGRRDHARRPDRRSRDQGRRRAVDAVHRRWCPHGGPGVRLAALGAPILRAHSLVHGVVHEL